MNRILTGLLVFFFALFYSGSFLASEKQAAGSLHKDSQNQSGETKRVAKQVGPFEVGKSRITVILDITGQEGSSPLYNSIEIKDETGKSYYKKVIGSSAESHTNIEEICKLEGKSGEGLIIYFDTEPNAPPAGKSFQVFGMEKSILKPLSVPINVYGKLEQLTRGKSKETEKLFDGDVISVDVWKGLIGVKVPLAVDFRKLTITPLKNEGIFDIYFITTPGKPVALPDFFYQDHTINAKVERIKETEGVNVEFLNAYAAVQLRKQNNGQELDIDVSNLWLKVKINGREGWIYDLNDFNMLGLPPIM